MRYLAKVYVTPKPAILDPQGKAIATSLRSMGYSEVGDVRLGKYVEMSVDAQSQDGAMGRVEEMCRRLLANEVIEEFRFEVEAAPADPVEAAK